MDHPGSQVAVQRHRGWQNELRCKELGRISCGWGWKTIEKCRNSGVAADASQYRHKRYGCSELTRVAIPGSPAALWHNLLKLAWFRPCLGRYFIEGLAQVTDLSLAIFEEAVPEI